MIKSTCLFVTLFLFTVSCIQVKPDNKREKINIACERFMKAFADARHTDAFIILKENTSIASNTIDTLLAIAQTQMIGVYDTYGKALSYELAEEIHVKDFLVKRICVLKLNRSFITFTFVLYKAAADWTITKFSYAEGSSEIL